ncbi:MAG TPA: hypothetical protein DHW49_00625, partial [Anaerolineae bacterium]|nr:hypothetical protein [Anaerolineae bacterium]
MELDSLDAKIGSLAPNFSLLATNGQTISLTDFRGKSNVIVFFIRETSCYQCKTHVTQLGKMYDQFREANTEVIVILGEDVNKSKEYAESIKLPFPILADPDRAVYH